MKGRMTKSKWIFASTVFMFGTTGIFIAWIPLSSGEIAFWRAAISFVILTGVVCAGKKVGQAKKVRGRYRYLLFSGAALGLNWILLFEAFRYTSVAIGTLCNYFAPTLIVVFSVLLFREKLNKRQVICFLGSTAGVVLCIGFTGASGGGKTAIGALCGVGAAVLYAVVVLLNRYLEDIDGLVRTWLQFAAAAAVVFPYVLFTSGFGIAGIHGKGLFALLLVCIVHTGITYCFYFTSIVHLKGQEAAILSYIDPAVAVMASFFIMGEPMNLLQFAGGVLILGFAVFNERAA